MSILIKRNGWQFWLGPILGVKNTSGVGVHLYWGDKVLEVELMFRLRRPFLLVYADGDKRMEFPKWR